MSERFRDRMVTVHGFVDDILVRCPRCGSCAKVIPLGGSDCVHHRRRLSCLECGYHQDRKAHGTAVFDNGKVDPVRDPFFRQPLWLQAGCCGGNRLWAYNREHVDFLAAFVGARLRDRAPEPMAGQPRQPMITKLPAWLKSAKHRDEILRQIDRLRRSLPG